MTTEKSGQKNEQEEEYAAMGCCSPQKIEEMMAKCDKEMHSECVGMMRKRMQSRCRQSKQK